jgi:hypothetical protein
VSIRSRHHDSWGTWKRLDKTPTVLWAPAIAFDTANAPVAVWVEGLDVADSVLYAARRDPATGNWGVRQTIASGIEHVFAPVLVRLPSGMLLLAYATATELDVMTFDGTAWHTDHTIPAPGGVGEVTLTPDASGDALLTWYAYAPGADVLGAVRHADGTWGPSAPATPTGHGSVQVSGSDSGYVEIFRHYDEHTASISVRDLDATTDTWSTPVTLATYHDGPSRPVGELIMASAVAANATGGAIVIWGRFLGHRHVTLVGSSRAGVGAAWSDGRRVPSPTGLPNAAEPSIQAAPAGDFVAGWVASARDGVGEGPPPSASVLGAYDAAAPVAFVRVPTLAKAGRGVLVRVHAYDTWSGVRGSPFWRFGDGSTARGTRIRHRWKRPGIYDVVLTVRDHRHHRRIVHRTITIRA